MKIDSARQSLVRLLLIAVLFVMQTATAYTCSVSATSITAYYNPSAPADLNVPGTYTIACTRLAGDPATLNWSLGATNGLHPIGQQNRVQLGSTTKRYNYEAYTDSTLLETWHDVTPPPNDRITGSMSFGDVGSTAVATGNFYIVVAANQSSSGKPAGTYSDQIQLTLRRVSPSLVLDNTATFNISVITDNGCTIASAPQALSFTYESFQPSDASTSTSFSMICTSGLPFQLSLDAPGGTLLGLNYSLTLPITNSVGTGSNSNYPINGKISYGQSGQCGVASCQASQTRTLTVTY